MEAVFFLVMPLFCFVFLIPLSFSLHGLQAEWHESVELVLKTSKQTQRLKMHTAHDPAVS